MGRALLIILSTGILGSLLLAGLWIIFRSGEAYDKGYEDAMTDFRAGVDMRRPKRDVDPLA